MLSPGIFHSLMLRLVIVQLTMGGLIVSVLLVSWLVFKTIEAQMVELKTIQMRELHASASVAAATDATRSLLSLSLAAQTPEALRQQTEASERIFTEFHKALDQLRPDEQALIHPTLQTAEGAVSELLTARSREFAEIASMGQTVRFASENASSASSLIEEANDSAFFDMTLSGEATIAVIDETLTRLVDEDFSQFQSALSIRGEINLIAGLALAFERDRRSQITTILADLAKSATDRLKALLEQNRKVPAFEAALPVLEGAIATFDRVFEGDRTAPGSSEILAARLAVDTALTPVLDDIFFNYIVANDDAKEANRASLSRLLEVEVEGMRVNASLDAATKHFFALLLQVVSARSKRELALLQDGLASQAEDVRRLMAGTILENQDDLLQLLSLADADTGLSIQRAIVLEAQDTAISAAQKATKAVDAIADETSRFSSKALNKIGAAAEFLDGTVDHARSRLIQIALVAMVIMLAVPILLWVYVTRPIRRVTLVTERLADGDLSEIKGLAVNLGELGRMSSALHVFRDNALKNIELREEERKRERAALKAEQEAEVQRIEDERQRAEDAAKRQKEERAREARLAADAEERQRLEIAANTARMEEQTYIVSTLAKGLNGLASGDLTYEIKSEFPATYDALRLDFNSAIAKLSTIVERLKGSSEAIECSCGELSSASEDLARRTEDNASTLAETASHVGNLSTSVAAAARNAGEATVTIQQVREKATLNNEVMTKAKSAMGRVEEASGKIASIVGIIDSIAFQTNLLALNAGVEAARAGSAGQGFAVVANEVRILAQRCSEAASEIASVVQESAETVQEGVDLSGRANEAMCAISEGIDQISEIVDDIAESAVQQSMGLEDVNLAIQNLDKSTQRNAAMFEQTSASNQLLSSEARALSAVVKSFVLLERGKTDRSDPIDQLAS